MQSQEIRQKFIDFFVRKNHKFIPSASLVPENDPSVLFISAGMHPLVPFLLGEPHPEGRKLVNIQKCLRTDDIDEVGDTTHNTFFEMLGYWSLGDYFKEESIRYSFDFFTEKLGLKKEKISVTVFKGDKDIPIDGESVRIWQEKIGIPKDRIYFLPTADNFWIAGETGPCGPCTEMFYDSGLPKCGPSCKPSCYCGKYVEIGNNVFMEYNKTADGKYESLKQKNVDVGLGLERITMLLQRKDSVFETDLFSDIKKAVEKLAQKKDNNKAVRIICDHLRAAVFIIADGVIPSNLDRGYVLRRLIRRAIRYGKMIGIEDNFCSKIAKVVISRYKEIYPDLADKEEMIIHELNKEEENFEKTLDKGIREFERRVSRLSEGVSILTADISFPLYDTYGFPIELTRELAQEKGLKVDENGFQKAFKKHQELSRKGAEQKFKGGLADASKETIKLHTAAHLLQQALREVLGDNVYQKGSNITAERLRFDFSHPEKMTDKQIKKVEDLVNQKIKEALPVTCQEMSLKEAKKQKAMGVFDKKYGQKVKVYYIGRENLPEGFFSQEICGGPHVKNTSELGHFKIIKEQSSSAGVRRIKAIIE